MTSPNQTAKTASTKDSFPHLSPSHIYPKQAEEVNLLKTLSINSSIPINLTRTRITPKKKIWSKTKSHMPRTLSSHLKRIFQRLRLNTCWRTREARNSSSTGDQLLCLWILLGIIRSMEVSKLTTARCNHFNNSKTTCLPIISIQASNKTKIVS